MRPRTPVTIENENWSEWQRQKPNPAQGYAQGSDREDLRLDTRRRFSSFQSSKGRGCYNCGELNHRVNTCRFDHRLKCGNCSNLGHKSKSCYYFTR